MCEGDAHRRTAGLRDCRAHRPIVPAPSSGAPSTGAQGGVLCGCGPPTDPREPCPHVPPPPPHALRPRGHCGDGRGRGSGGGGAVPRRVPRPWACGAWPMPCPPSAGVRGGARVQVRVGGPPIAVRHVPRKAPPMASRRPGAAPHPQAHSEGPCTEGLGEGDYCESHRIRWGRGSWGGGGGVGWGSAEATGVCGGPRGTATPADTPGPPGDDPRTWGAHTAPLRRRAVGGRGHGVCACLTHGTARGLRRTPPPRPSTPSKGPGYRGRADATGQWRCMAEGHAPPPLLSTAPQVRRVAVAAQRRGVRPRAAGPLHVVRERRRERVRVGARPRRVPAALLRRRGPGPGGRDGVRGPRPAVRYGPPVGRLRRRDRAGLRGGCGREHRAAAGSGPGRRGPHGHRTSGAAAAPHRSHGAPAHRPTEGAQSGRALQRPGGDTPPPPPSQPPPAPDGTPHHRRVTDR